MPEKQFRIVSLKESPFCPELGLIISLLLLFFHTLEFSSKSHPNHTGTKYSPAINLRSKILSQYLIVSGEVTCMLPSLEHTKSSPYDVTTSFFKCFFLWMFHFICAHVHEQHNKKPRGRIPMQTRIQQKPENSPKYIMQSLILISWIAMNESRKRNTFHSHCNTTQKNPCFHAGTHCRTGHLFQSTCYLSLCSVNLKQQKEW